jgi:hypothetical protein
MFVHNKKTGIALQKNHCFFVKASFLSTLFFLASQGSFFASELSLESDNLDTSIVLEAQPLNEEEICKILQEHATNNAPIATLAHQSLDQEVISHLPFSFDVLPFTNFIPNDEDIAYGAKKLDGANLPEWLSFDPKGLLFSGLSKGAGSVRIKLEAFNKKTEERKSASFILNVVKNDNLGKKESDSATNQQKEPLAILPPIRILPIDLEPIRFIPPFLINHPPFSFGIPNQYKLAGTNFNLNLKNYFFDIDPGDFLTFSFTQSINITPGLTLNPSTGIFNGTSPNGIISLITARATDKFGSFAQRSFYLIFISIPPFGYTIPNQYRPLGANFNLNLNNYFFDINPGDQLTYSFSSIITAPTPAPAYPIAPYPATSIALNSLTGIFSGTSHQPITYQITATAKDLSNTTASRSFSLQFYNLSPISYSIPNQFGFKGFPFNLNLTSYFQDPNPQDDLRLRYELLSTAPLAPWLTLNANSGILSETSLVQTATLITLRAWDPWNAVSSNRSFYLTIFNLPPYCQTIPAQTAIQAIPYSLDLKNYITDPNPGDQLTYSFTAIPPLPWLGINATTGILSGTPTLLPASSAITAKAIDQNQASTTCQFRLAILKNTPPNSLPIPNLTAKLNIYSIFPLGGFFSDPDTGDTLTFTGSASPIPPSGFLWAIAPNNGDLHCYSTTAGSTNITLTARDKANNINSRAFNLKIS